MAVIFTPLAQRHLQTIYEWIADNGYEQRAETYVSRIIAYCESFETFPKRGTRRDDILDGLRTIGFEKRVTIAFVVNGTDVLIEGIYYGGQDFESLIRDGEE